MQGALCSRCYVNTFSWSSPLRGRYYLHLQMRQIASIQQAGPKVHGRFVRTKVYLIFRSATSRQFEGASKSQGQSEGGVSGQRRNIGLFAKIKGRLQEGTHEYFGILWQLLRGNAPRPNPWDRQTPGESWTIA